MKKYTLYGILGLLSLVLIVAFVFMVRYVSVGNLPISQNVKYSFDDIKKNYHKLGKINSQILKLMIFLQQ